MRTHLKRLLMLLVTGAIFSLIACQALEKAVVDDDDLKKGDANQRLKDYERRDQ